MSCVTSLSPENGGGVCATYRFEGGATKLRIMARTTEGDYGDVSLTVVAKIPPKKSAQVRFAAIISSSYNSVRRSYPLPYGKHAQWSSDQRLSMLHASAPPNIPP